MSLLVAAHPELLPVAGAAPRARLLAAMTRVVAERGYATATVAGVVAAAGVSRSTFYEEFASKEELFLEAFRYGMEVLDGRVEAAVREQDDWRAQLRAGVRAYLEALQEDVAFARAALVEVHAAGPAAAAAHAEATRRFADRYARSARAARRAAVTRADPAVRAARRAATAPAARRAGTAPRAPAAPQGPTDSAAACSPEGLMDHLGNTPTPRTPPAEALFVLCAGTEQLLVERLRASAQPVFTDLEDVFCDCAEALLLGPAPTKES